MLPDEIFIRKISLSWILERVDFDRIGPSLIPPEIRTLFKDENYRLELLPRLFINDLVDQIEGRQPGNNNRWLSGPGGVGKSTGLVVLVTILLRNNETSDNPTLVVYVPSCKTLSSEDPELACRTLVDTVTHLNGNILERCACFHDLKSLFENSEFSYSAKWKKFLSLLRDNRRWNALFALDQWNVIFEKTLHMDTTHPLSKFKYLRYSISDGSHTITAVSGSFSAAMEINTVAFLDHEASVLKLQVDPLNAAEGELLRFIWCQRLASMPQPPDINAELMTSLVRKTGGIPRLLQMFYKSFRDQRRIDDAERECIDYYYRRINALMEKLESDASKKSTFLNDVANLCLGRAVNDRVNELSKQWIMTGMLKENARRELVPVAEYVFTAIVDVVNSKCQEILSTLADGIATRWSALELFVNYVFRHNRNVHLKSTDLRGGSQRNIVIQTVGASTIAHITSFHPRQHVEQCGIFDKGHVLLLWENHPVVDMVVYADWYDTGGNARGDALFFIQVSISPYANHITKLPHLGNAHSGWDENILNTYNILYGRPATVANLTHGKLPPGIVYVYITLSTATMKKNSTSSGHHVMLVDGSNCAHMDTTLWYSTFGEPSKFI